MAVSKLKFLFSLVGTAGVLAAGVAAYLYFNIYSGDAKDPLSSAKLVPNNALMAGFISTEPKSWSQLEQFGTPEVQTLLAKSIPKFNINIELLPYVKPWLGSVVFAVLPSPTLKPVETSNVLVVVGIKDNFSAWVAANSFKAQKGGETKEINYRGIKISETTTHSGKTYSALLDNHLVISAASQPVELAIDTFEGKPSFVSTPGAVSFFSQGVDLKNPIAQLYVPDYKSAAAQLRANTLQIPQLPPEAQVKSLVIGMGVDSVGLHLLAQAKINPSAWKIDYPPNPTLVVAQLPAQTSALISGQSISRLWLTLLQQSKTNLQILSAIDKVRAQLRYIHLDLDKDVLSWMDGEFALAVIPYNQGTNAPLGFGGALVSHTSDRATAQATLRKLDAIAKSYALEIAQKNVQGKLVTEWQMLQQQALLGYGWLDRTSVFVAFGDPILNAMLGNSIATPQLLDNSETFKAVTDSLPKPNLGYFYVDMDKTMSLLSPYLTQVQANSMYPSVTAILNSIRSIGFTATQPDRSTSHLEMFLALKHKNVK